MKPSNVGRLTFDQVVRLPLQVFVMTLVARHLGPERSGAYAYLFAIAALALALATVGPDAISMRRRAADPGGHGRTVAAALAFAVAPAGLALIPGFGALGAVVATLLSDRLAAHGISFPCPWLRSAARGQSRASHPVAAAVRLRQVYRGGGRDISPDRAAGRPLHVQPARPCRAHPRGALRERRSGGDVSPCVRAILPEDDVETPRGFSDFMSAALARARDRSRVWHLGEWTAEIDLTGLPLFFFRAAMTWRGPVELVRQMGALPAPARSRRRSSARSPPAPQPVSAARGTSVPGGCDRAYEGAREAPVRRPARALAGEIDLQPHIERPGRPPHRLRDPGAGGAVGAVRRAAGPAPLDDPEEPDLAPPPRGAETGVERAERARVMAEQIGRAAGLVETGMEIEEEPRPPSDLLGELEIDLAMLGARPDLGARRGARAPDALGDPEDRELRPVQPVRDGLAEGELGAVDPDDEDRIRARPAGPCPGGRRGRAR